MKIEQSLLDRFIEVRSPELTAEQVTQFFDGLTLNDITLTPVQYDGTNYRLYRGVMVCESRKWRALRISWTNTSFVNLVKPEFKYEFTLPEFLAEQAAGKLFVVPSDNRGNAGHLIIPHVSGQTYDNATIMATLGMVTGYDFSDVGTLKKDTGEPAHLVEIINNPTADDSVLPDIVLLGRAEIAVRISGPVVEGIVLFINDGYYSFAQDVDIGTLPPELPASE